MGFPALPAQGSTNWYPWAQAVHDQVVADYVINVMGEGADPTVDTGASHTPDSTAAFQSAISKATAATQSAPAAAIYVPAGTYLTEPLVLPNRVALIGDGPGTTQLLRANSGTTTGPFVSTGNGARSCSVRGLTLDASGVGDTSSHGLQLDSAGTNGYNDARHHVSDVRIQFTKGNGFHQVSGSTGVNMVTNVEVFNVDGHGFYVGTDSYYSNCDAGANGLDGFYIYGANSRLDGCGAWFNGQVATTNTNTTDGTAGHGFHLDGNWSTNVLVCCEGQDNARAGFYINGGGQHILCDCLADSNNTANLNHAGFELLSTSYCRVSGHAWDRAANTYHQLAGYRVKGQGGNWIDITARTSSMAQGLRTTDSDLSLQNIAAYNMFNSSGVGTLGSP